MSTLGMPWKGVLGLNMTPSTNELGKFIRARRLELGIVQTKLAKMTGIKQRTLSYIEIGNYKSVKKVNRLAKALGLASEQIEALIPKKTLAEPKTKLARLVRSRREELDLTQKQLTKKLRLTIQNLRILETRRSYLRHTTMKRLAKALKLELLILNQFTNRNKNRKTTEHPLGNLIRSRRDQLGMTLRQLAKKLGVTYQRVSQLELRPGNLGRNGCNMIEKLAEVLKLDVSVLTALKEKRKLKNPKRDRDTLGEFLTRRRLELHLTQQEVSKRMMMSSFVVYNLERNKYPLTPRALAGIQKALECKIPVEFIL